MKTILRNISLLLSIAFAFSACGTDDMNYKDAAVTPVKALYEPTDNRSVKLLSSASASLYFEWEAVRVEDSGAAQYEVLFDKAGGDFSEPIYIVVSDNNGYTNAATITHKVLNKIATKAGIAPGETGDVIWKVASSRGINRVFSEASRTLTITSLSGFTEIPDEVFITGEGSETGTTLSDALPFKLVGQGEFEIYTKLEAGKSYYFTDRNSGSPRIFYTDNNTSLKEAEEEGAITPQKTGVYRIELDFNVATISFTEITKMSVFFSPSNATIWDLEYKGKGIWEGTGKVEFKQESWGRDQRYKFQMETINKGGDAETAQWGPTISGLDSAPTGSDDYFFMQLAPSVTQWDNKWKFADQFDGANTTIIIYLQGDGQYRHEVK
ncbi:SusE domain-containing protein [Massilibacteroides sp.]|uniref:SusE domain-containing protein n=1 Tax=Massilibacteroides sp. TaxID=2034766 RepID=UPI002611D05A|nr:SusE domain-containing protein [Massilibacteroides sp.]MDD4515165.1 SusE domain-containing protein [Massilibacteroides sp.]